MPPGILDRALADRIRETLDRHHDAISYQGPSVLLHGDLHPRPIFASDGVLTGIIDWGDVVAGDPVFDLARYSIGGEDSLAALLSGYGLALSTELARRFSLYRLMRTARTLYDEFRSGCDWFEAYREQLRKNLSLLG